MQTQPIFTTTLVSILAICGFGAPWGSGGGAARADSSPPLAKSRSSPPVPPTPQRPVANSSANPPVSAPPKDAAPDPLSILRKARGKLTGDDVRSVRARLIERLSIGGRKVRLEGTYLQGNDQRLRLDLRVLDEPEADQRNASLLEVSDGSILLTRYQIGNQMRITRRDVGKIYNAMKSAGDAHAPALELGMGGLPALLASLEQAMTFNSLSQQEIGGKKFTVITGVWSAATLAKIKAHMGKHALPDHIPDSVRIYFEPDVLFPRRIAYLKGDAGQQGAVTLAELDFVDIVINGPIDEHQIEFVLPDGVRPVDVTNEYLQQIKSSASK